MTDTQLPIEGYYALLRNNFIAGPLSAMKEGRLHPYNPQTGNYHVCTHLNVRWDAATGKSGWGDEAYDIVGLINPGDLIKVVQRPTKIAPKEPLKFFRVVGDYGPHWSIDRIIQAPSAEQAKEEFIQIMQSDYPISWQTMGASNVYVQPWSNG